MTLSDKNLVSIIIPTYKRCDGIIKTIESVLCQSYKNIEIIVVDDNGIGTESQIRTEDTLKKYINKGAIKYITHIVNKNGSAARNTGFRNSCGCFIKFLDDDDFLCDDCIEKQIKCLMDSNSTIGATYCNTLIRIKKKTGKIIEKKTENNLEGSICKEYLLGECPFNTSAILFKREVIEELNGFDESFFRHQDYELMVRFFRNFKITCSGKESLVIYDLSSDRINIPNPCKDFIIKQKFLYSFQYDFLKWGFWEDVYKKFWFDAILNSILSYDRIYYKKTLEEYKKQGKLSFQAKMILLRTIAISTFLKLKKNNAR